MRPSVFLALALLPTSLSAGSPESGKPKPGSVDRVGGKVCDAPAPRMAGSAKPRLFGRGEDRTTFDLHLAVMRHVDGCAVPAILRRDVDAAGPARRDAPDLVRPL